MNIRLTHIDGKLPNLALMKLSHWHKSIGDSVYHFRLPQRFPDEPKYDLVYGSSIFTYSKQIRDKFMREFPDAFIGGTGSENIITVEEIIGEEYEHYDYSIYPKYKFSIGFTQRGCRLNCKFCVVPKKEGRPRSINSIYDIWRGGEHLKNVVLLDNDFFGQSKDMWMSRVDELIDGDFKVSFNQGINIRLVDEESAYWLSKLNYYDDQFNVRRLYTAWDNLKDEEIFFKGLSFLNNAGIPSNHVLVYMLIGYDKEETWERIFYRFERLVNVGVLPYPMVYNNEDKSLKEFQRWVVRRYYQFIPWNEFTKKNRIIRNEADVFDVLSV